MKQIKLKIVLGMMALLLTVVGTSCSDTPKVEDSKEIAETHNDAKFENSSVESDAQFLVNAAEINLQEMNLGLLAQQKSTNTDVIELGKMVTEAHTKSMTDLKALAMKKNITIPIVATEDAVKEYDKLNMKAGKEFNKEFCEMMVDGHKNAITVFEKATTDAVDEEIKNWAIATLPTLRMHSDKAISCETKIKNIK